MNMIITVIIVLAIIGVGVFVVVRKARKRADTPETPPYIPPTQEEKDALAIERQKFLDGLSPEQLAALKKHFG